MPRKREVAARKRLVGIKFLQGSRKKKFYQISEALTLFDKGMRRMAKYYPIPRKAISQFEEAVRRGDIVVMVSPGEYLEKRGKTVTAGRMVYSPSKHAWVIQIPENAFDEFGNLKPESLMTLWHELTHVVRSFVPQLEKLPTAYDEATTNFIADRMAMMFASEGVKAKYLKIDPNRLESARSRWRDSLVYKPELVESVFSKMKGDRIAREHSAEILEEFARGIMLKRKLRSSISRQLKYLSELRKVSPELYRVHIVNLSRKKLLKDKKALEKWAKDIPHGALIDSIAYVGEYRSEITGYLNRLRQGDERFKALLSKPGVLSRLKRITRRP